MATNSLTALLLEDEPLIALDLEVVLGTNGFDVTTVMTCADAMDWLSSYRPDIAVVDIVLRDGLSANVVQHFVEGDVPFIVHTGELQTKYVGTLFLHGHWLSKPAAPRDMVNAARALLSGNEWSAPRFDRTGGIADKA